MRARIIGTGSCLPVRAAGNELLSTLVDTSDEWIQTRTGIRRRHIASEGESTLTMAAQAARRAMENAGVGAEEIDLILVATCSSDTLVPSTACCVQQAVGAVNAVALDVNAACSGFVFALGMADAYAQTGAFSTALIIGVETLSRFVDWTDRSSCILFGDGAGAVVTRASERGVIAITQGSDGGGKDALSVKSREIRNPFLPGTGELDHLHMKGPEVFQFAVRTVPQSIRATLAAAGLAPLDVDLYFLHQANARINRQIARRLQVPEERFPHNIEHCGNTSAASIPILLDETNRAGLIPPGATLMLAGFGAGLTWGSCALTWG